MKKIGILTYCFGSNYGGTLQCFGLYNTLKKMGYDVKVINYIPGRIYSLRGKYINGSGIRKNIIRNLFNLKIILKKLKIKLKYVNKILIKFELFRKKNLILTEKDNSIERIIARNNFDYVIVGSDQVWNETSKFFLNEVNNSKIQKISYAACSGTEFYNLKDEKYLQEALKKFKYISVRNQHTKKFVEKLIKISPKIVCDPSILENYKDFLSKEKIKEKYIFTYILGADIKEGNEKVIEEIKKIYGNIKVVAVGIPFAMSGGLNFYPWADEVIYDAAPEDWLNYIKNAEFIYTDSYHGALFSMKFHKPFLAYYSEKNRAPRFMDLAERYNIDRYIVNTLEEAIEKESICKEIDYTEIDKLIDEHKKYSMDFLKRALCK